MAACRSFLVVAATFSLILSGSLVNSKTPVKAKEYILNLDLKPEDRWTEIVKEHSSMTQDALKKIIGHYVPEAALPLLEELAADIDQYLPSPFAGELRGLSKASNISLGYIVGINLVYEATAFCTSIVAQDEQRQIWHGRNLDYGGDFTYFTELLKNQTVIVHAQRNKTTAYTITTFVGYVGVVTGQKPHSFTVSFNERDGGAWWMNLLMALKEASVVGFLLRQTLDEATSYDDAVKRLGSTPTIAGAYYIVGGMEPGEGVVITKDRLGALDYWTLEPLTDHWYVLETNYDHWQPPPASDDRRDPGMSAMNATGQIGFNTQKLFKVLSVSPVLNAKTCYTAAMSARYPEQFISWIWYD